MVDRFSFDVNTSEEVVRELDPAGEYVSFHDFSDMRAERDALKAK